MGMIKKEVSGDAVTLRGYTQSVNDAKGRTPVAGGTAYPGGGQGRSSGKPGPSPVNPYIKDFADYRIEGEITKQGGNGKNLYMGGVSGGPKGAATPVGVAKIAKGKSKF